MLCVCNVMLIISICCVSLCYLSYYVVVYLLIHIHVLMLCMWFELIQIKIGFFKVAQKSGQRPCTIVHGLWPNFIKNDKDRILIFIFFF